MKFNHLFMIERKKIIVVLPAYNAAATLEKTYREIPLDIVDEVILVDDQSTDDTLKVAEQLGIKHVIVHAKNRGYGGNQKTCYDKALELGGDIIIMLHPDYQYTPLLIKPIAYLMMTGIYPVVLASRILGNEALSGGMPWYKYLANRLLTFFQNLLLGQKLSEYHTGYRGYSREVLETVNYRLLSDNFIFDNQILSQIIFFRFRIGEVACPAKYFKEASSINLWNSCIYGLGVLKTSVRHRLCKWKLMKTRMYVRKPLSFPIEKYKSVLSVQ